VLCWLGYYVLWAIGGFGPLLGHRVAALGGELMIVSAPGQGTPVQGRLPVSQMASSSPASSSVLQT
jgi:hypothetical protein